MPKIVRGAKKKKKSNCWEYPFGFDFKFECSLAKIENFEPHPQLLVVSYGDVIESYFRNRWRIFFLFLILN